MCFTTLTIATLLTVGYASPIPVPGLDDHYNYIAKKLGKKPTAKININGFKAIPLETDLPGLGKLGTLPLTSSVEYDVHASSAPIPSANGTEVKQPIADFLVSQNSATWGLGRISHRNKYIYNYVYDTSACVGTTAYVVATGIRTSHSEFGARAQWGANFVPGGLVSITAERGDYVGVCKAANPVAVKVLSPINDGTGRSTGARSWVMAGMAWAYNNAVARGNVHKSVQSLSIRGDLHFPVNNLANAIVKGGMSIVVAAGSENMFTIAASDINDARASFSNFGSRVDLFGPDVDILSSYTSCYFCYYYMSSTSMATPHISGLSLYFIGKEDILTLSKLRPRLVTISTQGKLTNLAGSPTRLGYDADGL
ncbi:peptidase S8/S53 domain-containing protein [Hyaloscypha sp. PMI_1271]|nr:peptidase S8/S53 domain-containing protein [Hyaloscypha sp. PMI_1271]